MGRIKYSWIHGSHRRSELGFLLCWFQIPCSKEMATVLFSYTSQLQAQVEMLLALFQRDRQNFSWFIISEAICGPGARLLSLIECEWQDFPGFSGTTVSRGIFKREPAVSKSGARGHLLVTEQIFPRAQCFWLLFNPYFLPNIPWKQIHLHKMYPLLPPRKGGYFSATFRILEWNREVSPDALHTQWRREKRKTNATF